MRSKTMLFNIA